MTKIQVTRSSMPPFEEYCKEIQSLWDSRWLTNMGAKHRQLEAELKDFLGVPNISLFVNGHLALETAIAVLGLPAGGEVITTPFTFASTTHAIVRNGLIPVFCDVREEDYTLDARKLESLVTERTVAILPVHVYGNVCQVEAIQEVASRHGLKVIYDAAHAFAVKYKGVGIANFGDMSMFSFHATKVFNTIEGGAVCFRDETLSGKLAELKNFGIRDAETVELVGGNAKMNEFSAAMGLCNLRHLDEEIGKRRHVIERYRQQLSGVPGIRLNSVQENVESNYAYFPVIFEGSERNRDEVFAVLASHDVMARKYFYPLTNSFACYQGRKGFSTTSTPIAAKLANSVLTLPVYADLALDDVDRICAIILNS